MTRFPSARPARGAARSRSAPSPAGCASRVRAGSRGTRTSNFSKAAHAASHALANALPLLLASHADVAVECFATAPGTCAPRRLLLYDKHPGGVGIARRAAPVFLELMRLALERVEACDCGAECEAAPRRLGVVDAETDGSGCSSSRVRALLRPRWLPGRTARRATTTTDSNRGAPSLPPAGHPRRGDEVARARRRGRPEPRRGS